MTDAPQKIDLETPDLAAKRRTEFEALFPGVLDDGVLDAATLGELLGAPVAKVPDGRESYGLQWAGRKEAIQSLLTPSRATLLPDLDNSVEFDTARNTFIEGDNLEVLKLLQRAYNDEVKLIYIDPPYNTGNDFVYNDDFRDGLRGYLEYTGQVDEEGNRASARSDVSGRRHSRWLTMMYPRLVLARDLLAPEGVLAVSIDANEVHQLKLVLDDYVFGSENHINTFVWVSNLKGRQISNGGAVGTHEYILVYARDASRVAQFRGSQQELSKLMPSVYRGAGYEAKLDAKGPYVTKNQLYNTNSKFNEHTAPTMVFRIHFNPDTAEVKVTDIDDPTTFPGFVTSMPHPNSRPGLNWHAWRWSRKKILEESDDLEFVVKNGVLRIWSKVRDVDGTAVKDVVIGPSTVTGQDDLAAVGLARIFDTPKPVSLLKVLVAATTSDDDLVLDFFAGSGSTAHAVALQNAQDGGHRRVISVNIPEVTAQGSEARKAGYETVSAITLARLRWVVENVPGARDAGLKVLKLGSSKFKTADRFESELILEASTLVNGVDDLYAVAAEVLLKEGVPLDADWVGHEFGDVSVQVSGGVAFVAGNALDVATAERVFGLEPKPHVVVFLEDDLAGQDALKGNLVVSAKSRGITLKTA